jgi:hypothetical protein
MTETYVSTLARFQARHGDKFSAPKDVDHLTRYFNGPRVEVTGPMGVRRGRISITTGWAPSLLLMHREGTVGSSDLLGPEDRVTAVIDKRSRRHPV